MIFVTQTIPYKRMLFSFRTWITVATGALFLIISLFYWNYFTNNYRDQILSTTYSETQTLTKLITSNIAPALYFNDSEIINEVIKTSKENSNLRFVVILDHLSRVVASYNIDQALRYQYLAIPIDGRLSSDGKTQLSSSSIMLDNQYLGDVYVGVSLDNKLADLEQTKRTSLIVVVLISLLGMGIIQILWYSTAHVLHNMALAFQPTEGGTISSFEGTSSIKEIEHCISSINRAINVINNNKEVMQSENKLLSFRLSENVKDLQQENQRRKETESALMESERRYRTIIEHSSDGIGIYSDDKFQFVNRPFAEMLRAQSEDDIIGRSFFDFLPPENRGVVREQLVRVLYDVDQQFLEKYTLLRQDNTLLHAEVSVLRINYKGKPTLQILVKDLARNDKSNKNEIPRTKKESNDIILRDFGILAKELSHDFANVLSIIVTGVNKLLFLKEVNKDTVLAVAEHITKAANRGNALIKHLSTFARNSSGSMENIQVSSLLLEIVRTLQQTFPQTISFDFRLSADVGSIKADSTQLQQVILHLCRNARNAMPFGGKLVITAENVSMVTLLNKSISIGGSEAVSICIHANGNIIQEEWHKKIFEPVDKTNAKTSWLEEGLDLVHAIMETHNGFVEVNTKKGTGALYTLYFPTAEENTVFKN